MLAPWCQAEQWRFFRPGKTPDEWVEQVDPEGCKWARVTGRQSCPSDLKKNLGWWFRNDYEQNLSDAPWFEPDKDQATRERDWGLRNPLQNARMFVWGCADKNYTVEVIEGHMNPMVVQRDDLVPPEQGYQRLRLYAFEDGSPERRFVSYCSKHLVYYKGTQPTGFFGVKFVPRL